MFLPRISSHGFPLTTNMARAFAWARSGTQGCFNEESGPGKHWWQNFQACHPELTLRTADILERSRTNALTRDVVNNYFTCLKTTLEDSNLINAPRQLFNCFYLLILLVQR